MEAVRFAPERTTLAAVVVMLAGSLPLALSSPYLAPLLLVPVVAAVWVLRARVAATKVGVEVCNGWGVRRFGWDDVAGFEVPPRGPVKVQLKDRSLRMTALARRDLPKLLEVGAP
jgi:hypothetical protein